MDKSRIQSAIDHIKTSVDIDPWAMELAVEALKKLGTNLAEVGTDTISRQAFVTEMKQMQTAAELWWQNAHEDLIKARAESCLATLVEIKLRLDKIPSAQLETCEGCKHLGKWENEVEYGYPSPCTCCKRRVWDFYER